MAPVFGNEPIETCDGGKVISHWINFVRGRGYYRVYFPEARSVLKSGKGKKQKSMWFNFATGEPDRPIEERHRYISIRNVENLEEMVFDV